MIGLCLALAAPLLLWSQPAAAYESYTTSSDDTTTLCAQCHGGFRASPYTSLKDGSNWGNDMHDVHRNDWLEGDCDICHASSGRDPVFLNSSAGGIAGFPAISCVGCHGRAEDAAAGGDYGSGLRQQHWIANRDISTPGGIVNTRVCSDCHSDSDPAVFTTVAENVPPPYYFTPDTAHPFKPTDPCDADPTANGSESKIGLTGLDNDGNGLIDGADASCAVANDPPVAVDDSYTTDEDTALNVAAPGVLTNDSDPESDPITAVLDTGPANGSLTLNTDGSFSYTPNADFNGSDSFTYFANDGTVDSNVATVSITVNAVNDPPVAVDDAFTTDEDTTLNVAAPGVLGNDSDVDGDSLTAALVAGPANGGLTLNADGSLTYTPNANFNGSDSFTYVANDGTTDSNTATVSITVNAVNDAPVAVDDSYTTNEDTVLNVAAPGVLGNDTDVDGDSLAAVLGTGPANGSLTLNADGSLSYTPNAGFNGSDSFTYVANDGAADSNTATVSIAVNAVNDAPVAVDDAFTTDEDTVLVVAAPGVLGNDTDADGDPITAVLVTGASNGGLTLNADGSLTYTPNANFSGIDSFTYVANDGTADSNTATVSLTINAVNDAPVAVDDSYTTNEDTVLNVAAPGVLGNDSDVDGDPLTAVLGTGPANGTLVLNADGSLSYTPNAGFNGSDSFTYVANDGAADSNTATVSIAVNAVNDAPVAVDDAFTTDEDTVLVVAAPGVLGNDTDADGDPITAVLVTGASNGGLTLNADGSLTYTPNANFSGSDSFTYVANDGVADSNVATVAITVNAVNDAPVAADDSYTTTEDTALNVAAPGVLGNDTDVDGDPLTSVLGTGPANGGLTLNADGSLTYTPNANFNGSDSFTYVANDGTVDSNTATVTIAVNAVNDAPVAVDDSYTTDEDVALTVAAPGVLGNDTDADGDSLTAALVTGTSNGSLSLAADGSLTYTPNADFNGSDSFTYVANDGTVDSNIATVTITVNAVNDAPVAADDAYTTTEDTTLSVAAPGVLGNDTDADGDPLTAVLGTGPANGSLTLNADGSLSYTPNAGFNGSDSFTYVANDGTADSNTATVSIAINAVNDAPVAVDDAFTTDEDTVLVVAAPGVLGNDADADGDPITAVLSTNTGNGSLTLNADGSFTYTPNANFNGSDSFTYVANDGTVDSNTATVSITVNAVNDAPVAVDDSYATTEDTALNVAAPGVLGNDTDVDGDPLTSVLGTGPANGSLTLNADGSFDYTPNAGFNGSDSFTYVANDGAADSNTATVAIAVNAVNDAPVAVDDSYTTDEDTPLNVAAPGVLGNDTDADGDALSAALVTGPANGILTLNTDGSFTYTPNADSAGADSFTYVANDGTVDSNTATVTIIVAAVNDAPVAVDDSYTTDEDVVLNVAAPGVLGNDTDVDGDPLTAVLSTGPANGTLVLNADGSLSYTPNAGFNGSDSFTYVANDGAADSNTATVSIAVNAVNNAPVATDDAYALPEDTPLSVAAPGILGNDTDADGDVLSAVLVAGPANGVLTLNADGSFDYTPNANFNGSDSFTYVANDGVADSNIATVSIIVSGVNDAPVAADDAYETDEDVVLNVAAPGVLGNDTDVDGDPLTAVLSAGPANGTLVLNADGSLTYTPNAGFNGDDSFTYVANDGVADSNVATVTITVNAVNNIPVAVDDSYAADEDVTLSVAAPGVLANDTDADGDPLTAALITSPANGAVTLNTDGSFSYLPDANFFGTDSFTYVANDGVVDSNIATVTITVNAVNDAPVAANDAYTTDEDAVLDVPAPGVLANDTDVDGDPLAAFLDTGPGSGTVVLNTDGSFTYTPDPGFFGSDSFTYVANDGAVDSNVATVTITVNAVDPDINLNPNSLVFGDTVIGTPKDLTTQIENLGSDDLLVDMIMLCAGTSSEYSWSPAPPFTIAPSGSQALTVTYDPLDLGSDTGCLEISSNDPDEDPAVLGLSGTGVEEQLLDLDIAQFQVTKRIRLAKVKPVAIKLVVRNGGLINSQTRPATVIGVQNGIQVYSETLAVSDAVGDGRSRFDFPPYTPTAAGDIVWTATIADDDPDIDEATAVTRVLP